MIAQSIGTRRDFTIAIQVFVHNVTGTPLRTDSALSAIRQRCEMRIHFLLCLSYADCFESPDFIQFPTGQICRLIYSSTGIVSSQGVCFVTRITVYVSLLVGQ